MATLPTIPDSQRSRTWTVTFPVDLKWIADDPLYAQIRESYGNQFSDANVQRWAILPQSHALARRFAATPRTLPLTLCTQPLGISGVQGFNDWEVSVDGTERAPVDVTPTSPRHEFDEVAWDVMRELTKDHSDTDVSTIIK
jgi:hypothetical protein